MSQKSLPRGILSARYWPARRCPAFPNLSPSGGNDFDIGANESAAKRRKTSHGEEDYAKFAGGDLDDDVAALLASQGK